MKFFTQLKKMVASREFKWFAVIVILAFLSAKVYNCQGQDMYYSRSAAIYGIQFAPGGTFWKPMIFTQYHFDASRDCHCDGCNTGSGIYGWLTWNTHIANPTIYPCTVDTAGKGYYFDECHHHFHSGILEHNVYNIHGLLVAGGSKQGYDWVSSGNFKPDSMQMIDLLEADPNWVWQDIPEVLPPYGSFTISGMRDDLYGRGYDGNGVIIGKYYDYDTLNSAAYNYVGLKDGFYRLHSKAYFDRLDIDQGLNRHGDEWWMWFEVKNDTMFTFDVPEPPMPTPITPDNIDVEYSKRTGNSPYITWSSSQYATYYEMERYIIKTGKVGVTKKLDTWVTSGTGLVDFGILASKNAWAAQLNLKDTNWKASWRVRAVNNSGASAWKEIKPKWVNLP